MTARIHIDFARPATAVPLRAQLLLVIGLLALAAVAWQWQAAGQRLRDLQSQRAALGRPAVAPVVLSPAESAAQAADLLAAQLVVQRLNQPWSLLFRQLESLRVPGVLLLAIQPENNGDVRRFRLVAQAPRYRNALDYVSALTATPGLSRAVLVAHEVLVDGGAGPGGAGGTSGASDASGAGSTSATSTTNASNATSAASAPSGAGAGAVQFTVQLEWEPVR